MKLLKVALNDSVEMELMKWCESILFVQLENQMSHFCERRETLAPAWGMIILSDAACCTFMR